MYSYCPLCGAALEEARDLRDLWIRPLRCTGDSSHTFLEVRDLRWTYPLQPLSPGVLDRLVAAPRELVEQAIGRLKRIDYLTVSIMHLEKTLLGVYRGEEYRVVWLEG